MICSKWKKSLYERESMLNPLFSHQKTGDYCINTLVMHNYIYCYYNRY